MLTDLSDKRGSHDLAGPVGNLSRFREFVVRMGELIAHHPIESAILAQGRILLADLIAHDDWLPDRYARPHPDRYQQYLLHCDSRERFSIVSFVWGPGQATPIHNHRVWGLVGVLRGAERVENYRLSRNALLPVGTPETITAGTVDIFSPRVGDIHRVTNARDDGVSVSIHVYGANIGAVSRSIYHPDGTVRPFISGYADCEIPNIWQPDAGAADHSPA